MKLIILTKKNILYEGKINSIKVPGKKNCFHILKNHIPIVTILSIGKITIYYRYNEKKIIYLNNEGILELKNNKITILID
ncbi:F0F1 ATP synthase subunit epsilon [Candidatus Shikimatogenerans silvanidophilus]|uniref:F0F1 ATP synthase subunit epsilon n=1 Tax=Candidatus Shikimatogenerans silvanidophilus TaxID=2782547 RepID=UPI001BAACCB0|nr:F0F1 ATP synthase subunit epsilon [Candidatus Shikimatogenerans silvanidophilus]